MPTVLVLPFVRLSPSTDDAWIAPAVEQSMRSDLARSGAFTVLTGPGSDSATLDESAAIRSARTAGARYVVFGSYQVMNHDVRFLGKAIDVETGQAVASLRSTGPVAELFAIQDAMGHSLKRQLSDARGITAASGPVPEIEPRNPLRIGDARSTFKGIEPSVAVDRHVIEGTYRYQYGRPFYFNYGYAHPTYFPRWPYAHRVPVSFPIGF